MLSSEYEDRHQQFVLQNGYSPEQKSDQYDEAQLWELLEHSEGSEGGTVSCDDSEFDEYIDSLLFEDDERLEMTIQELFYRDNQKKFYDTELTDRMRTRLPVSDDDGSVTIGGLPIEWHLAKNDALNDRRAYLEELKQRYPRSDW